jgi:hypothetical protein
MTPSLIMSALLLLVVCVLLAVGCAGNRTAEITGATQNSTPTIITPTQTQCPPQENTTPWIRINPVGDHYIGNVFEINGTTNLGANASLKIGIYQSHFYTEPKYRPHIYTSLWGNVTVDGDHCGKNRWSFSTYTSTLLPDEYFADITSEDLLVTNRSVFTLFTSLAPTQMNTTQLSQSIIPVTS